MVMEVMEDTATPTGMDMGMVTLEWALQAKCKICLHKSILRS
jgi:hypothetical protein